MASRTRLRPLALGALAVCALALSACGGSDDDGGASTKGDGELTTVKVGIIPVSNLTYLLIGDEQGFFREEGMKIETSMSDGGAAVVPKVVSGEEDIGYSNIPSLMLAVDKGLPLQVIADPGGGEAKEGADEDDIIAKVVVTRDSPIRDAKDLEGKTIAVNTLNNVADVTTKAALAKRGADPAKVRFLEVPFPDMLPALEAGRVDAAFLVTPFLQQAMGQGARAILRPYYEVKPGFANTAYFTTRAWAEEHPELVAGFQRAVNRSVAYAAEHPEAVRETLPELTRMPEEVVRRIPLGGIDAAFDRETFETLNELMVEYGGMEKPVDIDAFVHEGAMREPGGAT